MLDRLYELMDWPEIEAIVYAEADHPGKTLGPHKVKGGMLVQCFFPGAANVKVRNKDNNKVYKMVQEDEAGFYATIFPGKTIPDYEYIVDREDGTRFTCRDPYAFDSFLTPRDETRFREGISYELYEKLGAHPAVQKGVRGVHFAVWAPNAMRVSVVGDFNHWDGRVCQMERNVYSGIFELFIPDLQPGEIYKYELRLKGGAVCLKTDPFASQREAVPANASVVSDVFSYVWKDHTWMKKRKNLQKLDRPLSILEVNLKDWTDGENPKNYKELAAEVAAYAKELHYTHIGLVPIMEFMDEASSGYATSGYYAPTSRYGSPQDFQYFVDYLHQQEIGIIMGWTPAHFPNDPEGMAEFDGTCLYEHLDPRQGIHPFWGTRIYNYGSPQVKNFLIANAFYWVEVFHIDGLRMDDVDSMLYLDYGRQEGQWIPNIYGTNENLEAIEFLKHLNSIMKKKRPDVLIIAQEDGLWPELTGLVDDTHMGFDYKWNTGWTRDFLDYIHHDYRYRTEHHDELTLSMLYAYCESFVLTLNSRDIKNVTAFMESLPGTPEEQFAAVKASFGFLMTHPGKKMAAARPVLTEKVRDYLKELNQLYLDMPALYEMDDMPDGFEWIQLMEADKNLIAFLRKTDKIKDTVLVICNFSDRAYEKHEIGVPYKGKYKEIFNSDQKKFYGSGVVNPRVKTSKAKEVNGREHSITVKVPPLGISVFAYKEA